MPKDSRLPDLNIRVKGNNLPQTAQRDIKAITVHEDLADASMFTIELYNWDMDRQRITWSDDSLFAPGNEVEIWLGYIGDLQKVMIGEITGLEPAFHEGETPTLTVRGYDHRHRLLRGRKTRSFTKIKDSAIAKQIAQTAGLGAQVRDTAVTLEYVLQHNQTDLAFLQERARRIGYEVYVKDKLLFFRPPQHSQQQTATLGLNRDIIEFYPRLSTMSQVGEVVVRGWDIKNKAALAGKAAAGSESSTMGGTTSGPKAANKAFGKTSVASVSRPIFHQAEADQMALGQFGDMALAYISGEGLCHGRPDLRAGTVIKIEGAGKTFSGLYYITSTTHTMRPKQGYQTRFTYQRNAT